jgi:hypothetical protein
VKLEHRRDEFMLELISLHAEAQRLGLRATAKTLGIAALSSVEEITALTEKTARAKRKKKA